MGDKAAPLRDRRRAAWCRAERRDDRPVVLAAE
jgi:hypothetical protein